MLTATGLEGGLIYAASARLRDAIPHPARRDPPRPCPRLGTGAPDPGNSRIHAVRVRCPAICKAGSICTASKRRCCAKSRSAEDLADPVRLAALIKALPIRLLAPRPIDEAISSAGGVRFAALDARLMLRALPGVFCAGEMLDWEAPTGGYLLTACLASGRVAGNGVLDWFAEQT